MLSTVGDYLIIIAFVILMVVKKRYNHIRNVPIILFLIWGILKTAQGEIHHHDLVVWIGLVTLMFIKTKTHRTTIWILLAIYHFVNRWFDVSGPAWL